MQWFSFKGVKSTSIDVEAVEYVVDMLATDRSRYIVVPGRNGSIIAKDESLNDVIIKVSCIFPVTSQESLRLTARRIATWLKGDGHLIFWDEPDKFRNARIYNSPKLYDKGGWGQFDVQFRCGPLSETIESSKFNLNQKVNIAGSYNNNGIIEATIPTNVTGDRISVGVDGSYALTVLYNVTGGEKILIDLNTQDIFINQFLKNNYITPTSNFFTCPTGNHSIELAVFGDDTVNLIDGTYTYNACWL